MSLLLRKHTLKFLSLFVLDLLQNLNQFITISVPSNARYGNKI